MAIPRLIHQTAKTSDIPEQWRRLAQKTRDLHPGWTYRLWTDEDNLAFVKSEFPEFLRVYQGLPKPIMRADVIRYLWMFRLGGMYLDLDYELLKPFDPGAHPVVLPKETNAGLGRPLILGNCFFASEPGHKLWKFMIDDLMARPPGPASGDDILHATGPMFVTRIYQQHQAELGDVYLPEPLVYHPPTPQSPQDYEKIRGNGVSLGIHHCSGTWRPWHQRARTALKRLLDPKSPGVK